jgi:HAMP domain-containing protein
MDSQYVVEIVSPPTRSRTDVVADLARVFNVKAQKAEALLDRLMSGPATVGKPTTEADAQRAAQRFADIGLEVRVRAWITRPAMPAELTQPQAVAQAAPIGSAAQIANAQAVAGGTSFGAGQPYNPGVIGSGYQSDVGSRYQPAPSNLAGGFPVQSGQSGHSADSLDGSGPIGNLSSSLGYDSGAVTSIPATTANEPMPASLKEVDEATASIGDEDIAPAGRRVSLSSKFLFASILPTVLAVAMAIGAILLTVPSALRTLQLEGARNPAIALAGGVEGLLAGDALDAKVAAKLQDAMNATQATLREQNVAGVFVTDALGNPVAGWYGEGKGVASLPDTVRAYVQVQARRATAQAYMKANNFPAGTFNPPSRLTDAAGSPLEVAAHPVQRAGNTIGTVIYAMSQQAVSSRVQATVLTTLLASALPVVLAVLIAGLLAQSITRNVIRLVRAADRISLGNLDNPVSVRTNDELNDLGEALERMRVSLHESLERLRKRRR